MMLSSQQDHFLQYGRGNTIMNTPKPEDIEHALDLALESKDLELITLALRQGARPEKVLFSGIDHDKLEWVQTAIDFGASPDAIENWTSRDSDFNAIQHKTPAIVSAATRMTSGRNLKEFFSGCFHSDITDYLLSKGAQIDATDDQGNTALMYATWGKKERVINYLLENNADPLFETEKKKSPLKIVEDNTLGSDQLFSKKTQQRILKLMLQKVDDKRTADIRKQSSDSGTLQQPVNAVKHVQFKGNNPQP